MNKEELKEIIIKELLEHSKSCNEENAYMYVHEKDFKQIVNNIISKLPDEI